MQYNDFLQSIQRKFGDTSTTFNALVLDFLEDRIIELDKDINFRDLEEKFTVDVSSTYYTISLSAINTAYLNDSIISLKLTPSTSLQHLSLSRFQNDYKTDETGEPSHYVPINMDNLQLFPAPQTSYTLTGYIAKEHPAVALTSDYIYYTRDKIAALKFGVIADIYEDRGDDRYALYVQKFRQQLQNCRTTTKTRLQGRNQKLQLGS